MLPCYTFILTWANVLFYHTMYEALKVMLYYRAYLRLLLCTMCK